MYKNQVKPSSSSLVARANWISSSSPEKQTKPKNYNQPHNPKAESFWLNRCDHPHECSYITNNWFLKKKRTDTSLISLTIHLVKLRKKESKDRTPSRGCTRRVLSHHKLISKAQWFHGESSLLREEKDLWT